MTFMQLLVYLHLEKSSFTAKGLFEPNLCKKENMIACSLLSHNDEK